jgi:hypothetical protein
MTEDKNQRNGSLGLVKRAALLRRRRFQTKTKPQHLLVRFGLLFIRPFWNGVVWSAAYTYSVYYCELMCEFRSNVRLFLDQKSGVIPC